MKTLSLDFASHDGHLGCVEGDRVVALRHVERLNDADFIPALEGVLKEAAWAKPERIACVLGPGGFTSVRGAVAFANALADQWGVGLAGAHGSALALARCAADLWLHSTRQDQLFVLGHAWSEPTLVTLDEALTAVVPGTTVTGDLLEAHREALAKAGAAFPEKRPLEAVLPAFLGGLAYGKKGLVPWYGRGI